VTDDVTGLMWQQMGPPNPVHRFGDAATAGTAQNYCATLTLGGHSDWRLPNIIELVSLVDPSTSVPAIQATVFPGTRVVDEYWTSTPFASLSPLIWTVSFQYGAAFGFDPTAAAMVRCVRPTTTTPPRLPPERYTVMDGSVFDLQTKLTWQQVPPVGLFTWGDKTAAGTAQNYCATLTLAGGGWRLPTMKELFTLSNLALGLLGPTIYQPAFPSDKRGNIFWSATPQVGFQDLKAWTVNLGDGGSGINLRSMALYTRCVR
jgi:hypothetical protein